MDFGKPQSATMHNLKMFGIHLELILCLLQVTTEIDTVGWIKCLWFHALLFGVYIYYFIFSFKNLKTMWSIKGISLLSVYIC